MNIKIDHKLLAHLKEKNAENITISYKGIPSCKGLEFDPLVRPSLPKEEKINDYSLYEAEGINIYLDKYIEVLKPEELYIYFSKVGMTENYFAQLS
ncbi:MAG: hypothetical protein Q4E36_02765 [Bacillota bacterium]|nr:hypothetical protein [Bacillota bacterium]